MRILVQDAKTSMYFREDGPLTPIPEEAFDFAGATEALQFVLSRQLQGAQMVVRSSYGEHIAVPLPVMMAPESACADRHCR